MSGRRSKFKAKDQLPIIYYLSPLFVNIQFEQVGEGFGFEGFGQKAIDGFVSQGFVEGGGVFFGAHHDYRNVLQAGLVAHPERDGGSGDVGHNLVGDQ